MENKALLKRFLMIFFVIISLGVNMNVFAYPTGAPAGYTGSPADGKNCTTCHGGTATTLAGIITSNVPASGYTAGSNYTITVTLSGTGNKGFEVSPQSTSGLLLGTLTAGTGNKIVGIDVTHSSAVSTSPAVWNFTWTAPAAGTGAVTFYGAFAITTATTRLSTMVVNEASTPTLTVTASATPSTIVSGQTSQLNATATGGTGTYTYSWTSNPPGFTSTQQNPTVSPTVTTTYTVQVTSGTQNASASTSVTVVPVLTATASANPSTIVQGSSSQLSCTPSGGTGTYTYSWTSSPSGFTSTQQNPTVSPTVTTTYTVHVTSGTQSVNATTTVTVIPTLTATATATPSSIVSGGSSQLDVNVAGGTGSYTYSWSSVPAGFSSTTKNPVVSPTVTTVYTVQVTSGTQNVSSSVTVTVVPVLTATASATPSTIIQGQTSQLSCTPSGGTGPYTYSWTSSPSGFTSTQQNPTVSPTVTTTYTVHVTSGTQGVNASTTVTVIPTLTATATATPSSIVAGGSSQLDVNVAGGTGSYTYLWSSVPAGFSSTIKNPVVSPTVTTVYTVQVTSGTQTVSSSVTVNVGEPLTVTASANPASIIQGQSSQLSCSPAGGSGTYVFSWTSNPPGFTSTQQNPTVTPSVTTTYTVQVTSGGQSASASTSVTVTPLLTATATATPSSIVTGGSSQLDVNVAGGTGSYTYSWTSSPAGFTSDIKNPVVSPTVTTVYTVQVTSGTQSVSSSVTVSVGEPVSVTASADPDTINQGASSQLSAAASGGNGTFTYAWTSVPAGFTSTQQNPVVSPTVTTVYTVTATSNGQSASASVTVTVIPGSGTLHVTATADPTTVERGHRSHLNAIATGGTGNYYYTWTSDPEGFHSHQKSPYVRPRVTTTYTVTVRSGNETATASVTVTVRHDDDDGEEHHDDKAIGGGQVANANDDPKSSPASINDQTVKALTDLLVYPNPCPGEFRLSFKGEVSGQATVSVIDLSGRVVISRTLNAEALQTTTFDVSTLPVGIYWVQIRTADAQKTIKLVRQY